MIKSKHVEMYAVELAAMREMMLQKQVSGELDVMSLNRMLNRFEEIAHFIGRYEGEKYSGGNKL